MKMQHDTGNASQPKQPFASIDNIHYHIILHFTSLFTFFYTNYYGPISAFLMLLCQNESLYETFNSHLYILPCV